MTRPLLSLTALAVIAGSTALAVIAGSVGAIAQPASPRLHPSRDVVVTYRVDGEATKLVPGGLPPAVMLSWDAAGQRLRVESKQRSQVALIDLGARTAQAIDTALRMAMPLPIRPEDLQPITFDGMDLTPTRRETVAGLACNGYRFESSQGPGTVCLTPDGVPLQGQAIIRGKPGSFTATTVHYAPLPQDLFIVPPGYMALGGGSAGGGIGGVESGLKTLAKKLGSGKDLQRLLSGAP